MGNCGPLYFNLSLPSYDMNDSHAVESMKYSFYISAEERKQMLGLISGSRKVVTYIDGSCMGNPGSGGAGVALFDKSFVAG